MKIDLHTTPEHGERVIIPISEFSFAAYPVQIHQAFRCAPHPAGVPGTQDKRPWRGWVQQLSHRLRRTFGLVPVGPGKPVVSA